MMQWCLNKQKLVSDYSQNCFWIKKFQKKLFPYQFNNKFVDPHAFSSFCVYKNLDWRNKWFRSFSQLIQGFGAFWLEGVILPWFWFGGCFTWIESINYEEFQIHLLQNWWWRLEFSQNLSLAIITQGGFWVYQCTPNRSSKTCLRKA